MLKEEEKLTMSNNEIYNKAFIDTLSIKEEQLTDELTYQSIAEWDSVGHMSLVSALEDAFDIMMDTNDIIDFSSYGKGKEILQKYNISFD